MGRLVASKARRRILVLTGWSAVAPHRSTARSLDDIARRVADEQLVDVELDRVDDLFDAPSLDPFDTRSLPLRAGLEEIGATLATLRRLPADLTVRVLLPPAAFGAHPAVEVEEAVHRRAEALAAAAWRDATAVRSMGRRQTPLGLLIGLVGGFAAYGLAYVASQAHSDGHDAEAVALLVVAALALGYGWIVGWVTVESAILDWRLDAHRTDVYLLLSRARVELVPTSPTS